MKHTYYRIQFRTASAISVGSGENAKTDHDLIRHKNGKPYIPASSIAGVFRHYYDNNEALQNALFGTIRGETIPSALLFYDAELQGESFDTVRDSVKLENKVGVNGAKFDMEAIEAGVEFVTYLELDKDNEKYTEAVENLLLAMKHGILRFGHKTSRGYGETKITDARIMQFDLDDAAQLDAWLEFDMMDAAKWENAPVLALDTMPDDMLRIRLKLRQTGGLSIRVYSTDVDPGGKALPDFKQMTMRNDIPIIPGTSWAGAFRDRFCQLSDKALTDDLFGYVREKTQETKPSRILFSESQITGAQFKQITRNSIDRFSGATKDTALYTERTCYGGETELTITIPDKLTDEERIVLSAVVLDLHHGYLSLGGLTSVGRGLFSVEQVTVNGKDRTDRLTPATLSDLLEV